jgi:hypothetical protein
MKKIILIIFITAFAKLSSQCDSLPEIFMTKILSDVKKIDSAAGLVKKQKMNWRRKTVRLKYYSGKDRTISHKVVLRYRQGKTHATHTLRWGYRRKIKMLTLDDVPVYLCEKDLYEQRMVMTFIYLGNSKWYFNRKSHDLRMKSFFTRDVSQWR